MKGLGITSGRSVHGQGRSTIVSDEPACQRCRPCYQCCLGCCPISGPLRRHEFSMHDIYCGSKVEGLDI